MKKFKILFIITIIFIAQFVNGQKDNNVKLLNTDDSISYCLGIFTANNLKSQGFPPVNAKIFSSGLESATKGSNLLIPADMASIFLNKKYEEIQKKNSEALKASGEKFLAENKAKPGVITTASGLQYTIINEGTGASPTKEDKVTTHYTGTLIDGTVFDSSVERGQPATFPVNGVIAGWTEALQLMKVGAKWKLYIPYNLAYGERGAGGKIQPYAALIFDIELISIDK